MAEVVPSTQQEFWRPPVIEPVVAVPVRTGGTIEVCNHCDSEFLTDSKFCHRCGMARAEHSPISFRAFLLPARQLLEHLEFHNIERLTVQARRELGLSRASLVAFLIGVFCVIASVGVGMIFAAQTTLDWQAIQMWRIEWLLGALVSFVAGILLKRPTS